jgi:hypothetical protein
MSYTQSSAPSTTWMFFMRVNGCDQRRRCGGLELALYFLRARSSELLGSHRSGRTARSQQNSNEDEGKDADDDQEQWEISVNAGLQRSPSRIGGVDVHRYRRSDRKTLDNACCGAFPIELTYGPTTMVSPR